jgi:hypothetical protein
VTYCIGNSGPGEDRHKNVIWDIEMKLDTKTRLIYVLNGKSWFDDFSINKKNICYYIMECKTQIVVHNWKLYLQLHN